MMTFNQISQSAVYRKDEVTVSLTVCGGSYGGGSEVLVVDETFDICRGEILQMAESGNERVSSGEVGKLWGGE